jgi:hypothetical protein
LINIAVLSIPCRRLMNRSRAPAPGIMSVFRLDGAEISDNSSIAVMTSALQNQKEHFGI